MKKSILLGVLLLVGIFGMAQNNIVATAEYTPQIGTMVSMLDDLKARISNRVVSASESQTDFLLDEDANRIGALIMHLAATEKIYQVMSFEGRQFNAEERLKWDTALNLGSKARKEIKGKPINYYLEQWDAVRKTTKSLLKNKDDQWFASPMNKRMNNHWAWFHVMEHQANHMGQIVLLLKRASK